MFCSKYNAIIFVLVLFGFMPASIANVPFGPYEIQGANCEDVFNNSYCICTDPRHPTTTGICVYSEGYDAYRCFKSCPPGNYLGSSCVDCGQGKVIIYND